jgi:glycosidase
MNVAAAAVLLAGGAAAAAELLWTQPSTALPDWMRNQVVYEINVRQYSAAGTFAAVEADLDRIARLGAGTLWFMPIHPIGALNRKGELGSYYSISDYMEVNPEFGTKADFKSLVDAAHARGMRVILDWVGNHTAWDNVLTQSHPEFFMTDAAGNFIPPIEFPDWTDVIQVDYNNPGMLAYQIEAMRYWVTGFGVDGYRCDYATGLPTGFWNALSAALLETRPDLFLLAEAEVTDHQLEAFHASYGWPVMHAFNDVAQGKQPASHIDDVLAKMRLEFPAGADFLFMTTNHDENSWNGTVFERLGGGAEVFSVLTYVLDGIPLLYNGQEAGMDKRLEFFTRDPIEWRAHRFFKLYQTLNELKRAHPALATGAASLRIPSTADGKVYTLLREAAGRKVLFIGNLTAGDLEEKNEVQIGSPAIAGRWRDALTGELLELGPSASFDLKSWQYRLLVSAE